MTTVTGAPLGRRERPTGGLSGRAGVLASQRAKSLLAAGVLGAHAIALVVIGISWLALGRTGLVSALFGAALVIVFQVIGQAVQVRFAQADPRTLLAASLASFGARVGLLMFVLWAWFNLATSTAAISRPALVISAALTVIGWLGAEAIAWQRLRIPNFDENDLDASGTPEQAEDRK